MGLLRRLAKFKRMGFIIFITTLFVFPMETLFAVQDEVAYKMTNSLLQEKFYKTRIDQKIDVEIRNETVEDAIRQVANRSGLKLTYRGDVIENKIITIVEREMEVTKALNKILEGTNLDYKFSEKGYLLVYEPDKELHDIQFQETIIGTVTDAQSGEPLPGVNVTVQGTQTGTVTDIDGNYEITVESAEQVLIFSMVGFQRYETEVGPGTTVNVELKMSTEVFDELVVTAFGVERERRSLGYATQTMGGNELTEAREPNLASGLKGRVAGVQITQSPAVGGSSNIMIRGVRSVTGDNQPLIVVDGMPIDNQNLQAAEMFGGGIDYGDGLGNINPDDIGEITVLKGPNAAALYGARAANGAILITTKTGTRRSALGVEVNSNVTFDQFGLKPRVQNKYGGRYSMDWDDYPNTVWFEDDVWRTNGTPEEGPEYKLYQGDGDFWGPPLDGSQMIVINRMRDLGPVPAVPQPRDNFNDFFDTGITATNSIAFSGGDDKTTYRMSFANLQNKGVVPSSEYDQNSVLLRVTSQLSERLTVNGRANYVRSGGTNRPSLGVSSQNMYQSLMYVARFVDLEWLKDYKMPVDSPAPGAARAPRPGVMNPYWMMNEVYNEDQRDRINGFLSVSYNLSDWLNLQVRSGTDTYTDQRYKNWSNLSPGNIPGRLENHAIKVQENNADALLTATNSIGADFSTIVSVGGNYLHRRTEQTGLVGTNLEIPNLFHISNANNVVPIYNLSRSEMQSVFGTAQVGFRDYLYLDLGGRNDWSSTLGSDRYSFFYPSTSVSFVFSDAFNISSDILTFGKLRASYAQTGMDARPYLTTAGYNIENLQWNGERMASVPGNIPLFDLKNELSESYEIGGDFVLFDNRLSVDMAYYHASTSNQIFTIDVGGATGYNQRTINAGRLDNSGFEITLDATAIQTNNFSWNVSFNFNKNNSEIKSLAEGVDNHLILSSTAGTSIVARPGEPFGQIEGNAFIRNEEGQPILDPETGRYTWTSADDPQVLGNIQPDWTGGLINTFYYKGFSLGTVLDIRWGGDMFSMSMERQNRIGQYIGTEEREPEMYIEGVIPNLDGEGNPDGSFRENTPGDGIATDPVNYYCAFCPVGEKYIVDGSYISLRELTLGYTFGSSFLQATPFESIKLSAVARNVLYLKQDKRLKEMGVSPESVTQRGLGYTGVETMNFPLVRTIGFNVNVQF